MRRKRANFSDPQKKDQMIRQFFNPLPPIGPRHSRRQGRGAALLLELHSSLCGHPQRGQSSVVASLLLVFFVCVGGPRGAREVAASRNRPSERDWLVKRFDCPYTNLAGTPPPPPSEMKKQPRTRENYNNGSTDRGPSHPVLRAALCALR